MIGYDLLHAGGDVVGTWAAPLHSSGRDWLAAAGVVAIGAAISPFDDNIDNWFLRHQSASAWSAIREFREGGKAFAGSTITPAALGVYIIGVATKSEAIRDGVWGCVASYASESVVRSQVMYRLIGRLRPDSLRVTHIQVESRQGDQYKFHFPGGEAWGKHSLPAGHIANIAACASFLSHRFDNIYVTVPAYAVVAAVGIGRQVDRRHWTSDTFLGAMFGYAVGKEVAMRSRERRERERRSGGENDDAGGALFLAPSPTGIRLGWQTWF
jgi:membrane-associated phospholipid phosphatase